MCGICGIINFNKKPVEEFRVRKMMGTIKHRGPDDEGVFFEKNVGLGFVRLSILDLSMLGHQPMFDDSGRFLIIHNGEVYNFIEIREELRQKGYNFKSNTDTEVILKSYMEWGDKCLHKFNGMWAFCIYDTKTKEIFISRDRYGIKPFYYYYKDNQFIFASEMQAIISVLTNKPQPNNQAVFDYLIFNRTDQTEQTFFNDIKKLQHGCNIKIKENNVQIYQWYNLRKKVAQSTAFNNPHEYYELFKSAIGLRLRSDVPVGVCLSGGLDSSSITSVLLRDFNKNDLNTFSAVYGVDQPGDESEFIMLYDAPKNPDKNTNHTVKNMFFTTPDAVTLFDDIPRFVRLHGEPVPSTAPYAQFKVMELAQKNVVVTLDGQGADELLAGYHYFYGYFYKNLLKNLKLLKLLSEIIAYSRLHKSIYGIQTFLYFLLSSKLRTLARVNEKGYLVNDFKDQFYEKNTISGNLYGSESLNDALLDHFEFKLEHLLKWEDRNSMFFSLESRVPFLDFRLVEKTLSVNDDQIIKNGWSKYILRQSMKGILPEQIRLRKDKIGFNTPEEKWFRTEQMKKFILEIINSKSFSRRGIIDPQKVNILYQDHLNNKRQISKEIWKWINLEYWFREFID